VANFVCDYIPEECGKIEVAFLLGSYDVVEENRNVSAALCIGECSAQSVRSIVRIGLVDESYHDGSGYRIDGCFPIHRHIQQVRFGSRRVASAPIKIDSGSVENPRGLLE
jgi:hypothetical protein